MDQVETRYQRIGREQRARQAARAVRFAKRRDARSYVGVAADGRAEVFRWPWRPTRKSHGGQYVETFGPFTSQAAAKRFIIGTEEPA